MRRYALALALVTLVVVRNELKAQNENIINFSCSRPNCVWNKYLITTGEVSMDINAVCENDDEPHAHASVGAYQCLEPVDLHAHAYPQFPSGPDLVDAHADAWSYFYQTYIWAMFEDDYCDTQHYQYIPPPADC